jgi:hypothetical protein
VPRVSFSPARVFSVLRSRLPSVSCKRLRLRKYFSSCPYYMFTG